MSSSRANSCPAAVLRCTVGRVPSQPFSATGRSKCQSLGQSASIQSGTRSGATGVCVCVWFDLHQNNSQPSVLMECFLMFNVEVVCSCLAISNVISLILLFVCNILFCSRWCAQETTSGPWPQARASKANRRVWLLRRPQLTPPWPTPVCQVSHRLCSARRYTNTSAHYNCDPNQR